jgi:uncharacterized protein YjbI with pentapeptide repeats
MTGCNLAGAELDGADLREAILDPGVREMHAKVHRSLGQSAG